MEKMAKELPEGDDNHPEDLLLCFRLPELLTSSEHMELMLNVTELLGRSEYQAIS